MKTQLSSAIRDLSISVYGLLSNPQAIRIVLIVLVVCFALAALIVPALASGLPGGGGGGVAHITSDSGLPGGGGGG